MAGLCLATIHSLPKGLLGLVLNVFVNGENQITGPDTQGTGSADGKESSQRIAHLDQAVLGSTQQPIVSFLEPFQSQVVRPHETDEVGCQLLPRVVAFGFGGHTHTLQLQILDPLGLTWWHPPLQPHKGGGLLQEGIDISARLPQNLGQLPCGFIFVRDAVRVGVDGCYLHRDSQLMTFSVEYGAAFGREVDCAHIALLGNG